MVNSKKASKWANWIFWHQFSNLVSFLLCYLKFLVKKVKKLYWLLISWKKDRINLNQARKNYVSIFYYNSIADIKPSPFSWRIKSADPKAKTAIHIHLITRLLLLSYWQSKSKSQSQYLWIVLSTSSIQSLAKKSHNISRGLSLVLSQFLPTTPLIIS